MKLQLSNEVPMYNTSPIVRFDLQPLTVQKLIKS